MTLTFFQLQQAIDQKFKEIDLTLNDVSLTKKEKQILEETRMEYEEQSEELQADVQFRIEEIEELLLNVSLSKETIELLEFEKNNLEQHFFNNEENYEDEDEDENDHIMYELIHFKSWFEGCTTIDEVLSGVDALKQQLEQFKKDGHELLQPVDTGYCYINKVCEE